MPRKRNPFPPHRSCLCGEDAWIKVLRRGWCRKCFVELNETFDTPTKSRLGKYGLHLNRFAQLFIQQEGVCRICRSGPPLVIDHDHATGRVRGLLCSKCNTGLGFFRDDPRLLREAIRYLDKRAIVTFSDAAAKRVRDRDRWRLTATQAADDPGEETG